MLYLLTQFDDHVCKIHKSVTKIKPNPKPEKKN